MVYERGSALPSLLRDPHRRRTSKKANGRTGLKALLDIAFKRGALVLILLLATSLGVVAEVPPTADIAMTVDRSVLPHRYTFNGSGSSDPDGVIRVFAWDFGDGTGANGVAAEHEFDTRGAYTVTLVVVDDSGASSMTSMSVYVSNANVAPAIGDTVQEAVRPSNPTPGAGEASPLPDTDALVILGIFLFLLFLIGRASKSSKGWRKFEKDVAARFRRDGWLTELTPGQNDGGIDIRMERDGIYAVVECKCWKKNNVGVSVLRQVYGVLQTERASKAFIVTSSDFTSGARTFAMRKSSLELVNGKRLKRWMSSDRQLDEV